MKTLSNIIILCTATFFIISSCASEQQESTNSQETEMVYDTALSFQPEMRVDWFALRVPEAYYQSFKEHRAGGERFIPDTLENQNRVVSFLSFNRDEKLELMMYPSDSSYSFSIIELRKATPEESSEESGLFGLHKDPLKTGNEIKIGSAKSEVIAQTGEPMNVRSTKAGENLEYWIESLHISLMGHHTKRYFLTYEMVDDKVEKIRFGFEKME